MKRILATVLAVALLLASAAPGKAAPVIFSDGTFSDSDWSFVTFISGNGGSVEASQDGGGNPGPSRRIRNIVNPSPPAPAFSAVFGAHFSAQAVYDPMDGAIATVDFLEEALLLEGFGDGQATGLALRQNGMVYIRQAGTTPGRAWTRKESLNVPAGGVVYLFDGGSDGTQHPDFSTAGAPIEFGFYRADSTSPGANGYQILAAIDNWTVRLNPPCASSADCVYPDPCLVGVCQGGACLATPKPCDDGDACTADACVAGACAFTPVVCDDGVSCTADACGAGGCQSTVDFALIENAIDEVLGLISTAPCAGDIPGKLRRKLGKKLRKAQKKLVNADAATKARLIENLIGRADSLLGIAGTLLAGAQAAGIVSAPCATALSALLTDVSGCVAALPAP